MVQETIFVQTDPAFNIVVQASNELKEQERLQVTYYKTVSITNIESNDPDNARRFLFGGNQGGRFFAFGRTASSVLRMCMLEAASINEKFWPQIGQYSHTRNKGKWARQTVDPSQFHLADNLTDARKYWSKYDQLYPQFAIQHKLKSVAINTRTSLPSMMMIFRGNFTEFIEITTTLDATQRKDQKFDSFVHVTCIVRSIKQGVKDGKFTVLLKEMLNKPISIKTTYYKEMTEMKAKKKEDLENLPDALKHLKICDYDVDGGGCCGGGGGGGGGDGGGDGGGGDGGDDDDDDDGDDDDDDDGGDDDDDDD